MSIVFGPLERKNALTLIDLALAEDLGDRGDITAQVTIPESAEGTARFVARREGFISGLPVVALLAERLGLHFDQKIDDGTRCGPMECLGVIAGPMRAILGVERTALNFLQRLSGVATLTARYVDAIEGTRAEILDTRKTTPGWRHLEKYAIRCGGGKNHRIGLYDAVLIKDNHIHWLATQADSADAPVARAVRSARAMAPPGTTVEIEVDTLEQLEQALAGRPDIILVDNFDPTKLAEAIRRRDRSGADVRLEVSGGVNLETVRGLALTGVERISVGALTHSAPALDIGLDYGPVDGL